MKLSTVPNPAMSTTPAERASRYEALAAERDERAVRVRTRAEDLRPNLEPLRRAMSRRASELELSASVLRVFAESQRMAA